MRTWLRVRDTHGTERIERSGGGLRWVRHAQEGQGMIEYALIAGILIVGAVAVLTSLSQSLNGLFSSIANTLAQY